MMDEDKVIEQMGWCGCGDPEAAADYLRRVLQAIADRSEAWDAEDRGIATGLDAYNKLKELVHLDDEPGLGYMILYILAEKELTEHGGSVGGEWLTDKGKELLEELST